MDTFHVAQTKKLFTEFIDKNPLAIIKTGKQNADGEVIGLMIAKDMKALNEIERDMEINAYGVSV